MGTFPRVGYKPVSPGLLKNQLSGREKVIKEGQCRMCQRPWKVRPSTQHRLVPPRQLATRHHLVPESWFLAKGRDERHRRIRNVNANIVPLCRVCHDRVDSRDPADRQDARRELRRCLGVEEIAFMIQVRGKSWLDFHYPPTI